MLKRHSSKQVNADIFTGAGENIWILLHTWLLTWTGNVQIITAIISKFSIRFTFNPLHNLSCSGLHYFMAVKNKDDRIYKTEHRQCCWNALLLWQMFKMLWATETGTDQMLTAWLETDVLSCYHNAKGALGEPCTNFSYIFKIQTTNINTLITKSLTNYRKKIGIL